MRKLLFTALILATIPALAYSYELLNARGKVGTVTSCVSDTDVDVALSTTVDLDSAAAQKTLNIASTGTLAAGDTLLIDGNQDGDGREVCVVDTVSAGASVDCVDNLTYTHTAATGDEVVLTNRIGPLSENQTYFVTLTASNQTPEEGRFLQGDEYVDAATNGGVQTAGSLGPLGHVIRVTSKYKYISFNAATTSAIARACKIE